MTLKGHYALCHANRALMWLYGKSQGIGNGTVGWGENKFLYTCVN